MIIKQDITTMHVDCIVNAANSSLLAGGGVCGAIFKAAGYFELTEECRKIGHCKTGSAVITKACNLKSIKYIIHAVGPIYNSNDTERVSKDLYKCYKKSLELMLDNDCYSIAFPLISSGIYGYPIEDAWKIALNACNAFLQEHNEDSISIYFTVINDYSYELGIKTLNN